MNGRVIYFEKWVHSAALERIALREGRIAGAGVDVWEDEPPPLDHPLLGFDNVVVSPHTAGVTHVSRRRMALGTVEQIVTILSGERPPRLLNPDAWDAFRTRHARIAPG